MKKHSESEPTLADLLGRASPPGPKAMTLDEWFWSIQDIPITQLPVEHLAKAIRQELCLEQLIPIALKELVKEPLAGELYRGELMAMMTRLPADFWRAHPEPCRQLVECILLMGDIEEDRSCLQMEFEEFVYDHLE